MHLQVELMIQINLIYGKEYFVDGVDCVDGEGGPTPFTGVIDSDASDGKRCKDGQGGEEGQKRLSGKDKIV